MSAEAQGPALFDRTGIGPDWFRYTAFVVADPDGAIVEAGRMSVAGIEAMRERTGRRYVLVPPDAIADLGLDMMRLAETHCVATGDLLARKTACPATLAGLTLSGLPVPCRIEISDPVFAPATYPVASPELDLSFEHPGTHTIRVLSAKYLPGSFEVTT